MLLNLLLDAANGSTDGSSSSGNTGGGKSSWLIWVIFAVMIVVMILLTAIPNKKRQKEYNQMINSLHVGTKIMTIGRMIGTITKLYDDGTLELDVGTPGNPVIITISRDAISTNLTAQAEAKAQAEAAKNGAKKEPEVKAEETETAETTEDKTIAIVDETAEDGTTIDTVEIKETEEPVVEEKKAKKEKKEDDAI